MINTKRSPLRMTLSTSVKASVNSFFHDQYAVASLNGFHCKLLEKNGFAISEIRRDYEAPCKRGSTLQDNFSGFRAVYAKLISKVSRKLFSYLI